MRRRRAGWRHCAAAATPAIPGSFGGGSVFVSQEGAAVPILESRFLHNSAPEIYQNGGIALLGVNSSLVVTDSSSGHGVVRQARY